MVRLVSKKELISKHPALGEKPHRINWLVRTRQIPCVRIGKHIYFDEADIDQWIRENSVEPGKGGEEK